MALEGGVAAAVAALVSKIPPLEMSLRPVVVSSKLIENKGELDLSVPLPYSSTFGWFSETKNISDLVPHLNPDAQHWRRWLDPAKNKKGKSLAVKSWMPYGLLPLHGGYLNIARMLTTRPQWWVTDTTTRPAVNHLPT